jgi:malate dehydrogenase (oxaloacetate-decarboxylating)(NADP+)
MRKDLRREQALEYHAKGRPGKIEVVPTKEAKTQRDLSLAYSPGVAEPCKDIHADPDLVYKYTAKGNLVAVISNGTAVLGLGDIGPEAGKPVMEGKGVLFKIFADIDVFDIEINEKDPDRFVEIVKALEPTFGGVNLEDIKAPECFHIEQRLKQEMRIPVMHDDQHGTAIISAAALLNALELQGKRIGDVTLLVNGAGAAALACIDIYVALGVDPAKVRVFDSKGLIHRHRTDLDDRKRRYVNGESDISLEEAFRGTDVFIGLSKGNVVSRGMVASMAPRPIVFAMANPDPEISWEDATAARADIIMATGRSDYPNQVNNVLGFPYIFRGAFDVRASTINEPMKIAAAEALALLAREDVPDEVNAAGGGKRLQFGPDYIIPNAFDPRLISRLPPAVAKAAMDSGVARKPIADLRRYTRELTGRLDPTANALDSIAEAVRAQPRRVVFAEGEEEKIVRAAVAFRNAGYGTPVLIGREDRVRATMSALGLGDTDGIEIHNARLSGRNQKYAEFLYARLQRQGYLARDCQRMVNQDRNVFAACMVATGDADAMVTGLTRSTAVCLADIAHAIDPAPGEIAFGLTLMLGDRGQTIFIADTLMHFRPNPAQLAAICTGAAQAARRLGHEPRVALLSYSTFGNQHTELADTMREAVKLLDASGADFEYDGEMSPDVALDDSYRALYPFCRLTGPANILVMPGLHSAHITSRLAPRLGGGGTIGPLLIGLTHAVQLAAMDSSVSQILDLATIAAHQAIKA